MPRIKSHTLGSIVYNILAPVVTKTDKRLFRIEVEYALAEELPESVRTGNENLTQNGRELLILPPIVGKYIVQEKGHFEEMPESHKKMWEAYNTYLECLDIVVREEKDKVGGLNSWTFTNGEELLKIEVEETDIKFSEKPLQNKQTDKRNEAIEKINRPI